jgi:hypothetical protein
MQNEKWCDMIPYDEQVRVLRKEVAKAHDYICLEEFYKAKLAILNGDWAEENILEVLMRGNYTGAVARIAYYRFIHRLGFDVRALWDAIILEWMFYFVWQPEFDQAIKTKEFKKSLAPFSISAMGGIRTDRRVARQTQENGGRIQFTHESEVTGMERYEEEEKAKEEYEKHKCKGCVYAKWQTPYIVSCLFPRCVKERLEK